MCIRDSGAFLVIAVSIATKRLDTSDKPTKRKEDHNEVDSGAKPRSCSWYRTWLMTTST